MTMAPSSSMAATALPIAKAAGGTDAAAVAPEAPPRWKGVFGGGCLGALGSCMASLCEPNGPLEETGHVLLARMHEERERQLAAERAAVEERRLAQEIAARQWEEELVEIQQRRADMDEEELEQDCIAQFACSDILQASPTATLCSSWRGSAAAAGSVCAPSMRSRASRRSNATSRVSGRSPSSGRRPPSAASPSSAGGGALEVTEDEEEDEDDDASDGKAKGPAPPLGPRCPLEQFLADRLGAQLVEGGSPAIVRERERGAEDAERDRGGEAPKRTSEEGDSESSAVSRSGEPDVWLPSRWASFGQLAEDAVGDLVDSLAVALGRSADEADEYAAKVEGRAAKDDQKSVGFSDQFDEILRRYAIEEEQNEQPKDSADCSPAAASDEVQDKSLAEALRAKAARYRAVSARVAALAPCVQGDTASTRLVAALAALDLVEIAPTSENGDGNGDAGATHFVEPGGYELVDFRSFRAPLRALSTADACWALCSEKRRLVVERMLPGAGAEGRWLWPQVRRAGVGWWLCGAGVTSGKLHCAHHVPTGDIELVDKIVTKLAQSTVASLRAFEKTGLLPGEKQGGTGLLRRMPSVLGSATRDPTEVTRIKRQLTDEAVFWYALMGTTLTRLRALLKTGALSSEPALQHLLEHEKSEEPEFMRKNAYRLLQLHRYHLAVALFVLCDSFEEAARIVVSHLRDLQLLLVLCRRRPEASTPLLRQCISDLPLAERADPWLRVLLAWHVGDEVAATSALDDAARVVAAKAASDAIFAAEAAADNRGLNGTAVGSPLPGGAAVEDAPPPLFDDALRPLTLVGSGAAGPPPACGSTEDSDSCGDTGFVKVSEILLGTVTVAA